MNEEVIKAMNKKEGKIDKIHEWWEENDYKVMRVVLFPIYWGIKAKEKINNYLNSKCEWNEERANEILSYYIPRKADWDAEDNTFYFFDNGIGWSMTTNQKKIKLKDRRWWKCNSRGWGGKVREYLIKEFELEGFTKEVGDTYDSKTEIVFHLNEKIKKGGLTKQAPSAIIKSRGEDNDSKRMVRTTSRSNCGRNWRRVWRWLGTCRRCS